MPLPRFRVLTEAEARRQRRAQVNSCMAARSANFDDDGFEKMMRTLADG